MTTIGELYLKNLSKLRQSDDIETVSYTHLDVYKRQVISYKMIQNVIL